MASTLFTSITHLRESESSWQSSDGASRARPGPGAPADSAVPPAGRPRAGRARARSGRGASGATAVRRSERRRAAGGERDWSAGPKPTGGGAHRGADRSTTARRCRTRSPARSWTAEVRAQLKGLPGEARAAGGAPPRGRGRADRRRPRDGVPAHAGRAEPRAAARGRARGGRRGGVRRWPLRGGAGRAARREADERRHRLPADHGRLPPRARATPKRRSSSRRARRSRGSRPRRRRR